jgi:hypothetical protein
MRVKNDPRVVEFFERSLRSSGRRDQDPGGYAPG